MLSSLYILWLYQRVMTGPVAEGNERIRDLVPREILVVAPLIALLLVLGVYPKPVLDIINPAVGNTMATIGQYDPACRCRPAGAGTYRGRRKDHADDVCSYAHTQRRIWAAVTDIHRLRCRRGRCTG